MTSMPYILNDIFEIQTEKNVGFGICPRNDLIWYFLKDSENSNMF